MHNLLLYKYDKYLYLRKNLDGTVTIYRRSPYSNRRYVVLVVQNQYLGSFKWVLRKIVSMDSTRQDFFVKSINNNLKVARGKTDNRSMSKEIVEFVQNSGLTFVN